MSPHHISDVIHDMFSAPGAVHRAHAALVQEFKWFLHRTDQEALESIRNSGLLRSFPSGSRLPAPGAIEKLYGVNANRIVCLAPLGTRPMNLGSGRKLCTLAISKDHLPEKISLDGSFPDGFGSLEGRYRSMTFEEIVVEIARQSGSIAIHEDIPPNILHVRVASSTKKPDKTWPLLTRSNISDVFVEKNGLSYDEIMSQGF